MLCRDTNMMAEEHLTILLQSGVLTRHSVHADVYVLAIPGAGPVVKSLLKGRKVWRLRHLITMPTSLDGE